MASAGVVRPEASAALAAPASAVFALLDDPARLGAHMGRRSWWMAGGAMQTETDTRQGRALESVIRMKGRILGIPLFLEESVNEYAPPLRKSWLTRSEPRLLVIGRYRMGFILSAETARSTLRVCVAYAPPSSWPQRWLGRLFGRAYARGCSRQTLGEATQVFAGKVAP